MQGDTLLNRVENQRPIFATEVGRTTVENELTKVDSALLKPPFYHFGFVSMIDSNQWYQLYFVDSFSFVKAKIGSYNTTCPNEQISDVDILHQISDHLKTNKIDTMVLEEWVKSISNP